MLRDLESSILSSRSSILSHSLETLSPPLVYAHDNTSDNILSSRSSILSHSLETLSPLLVYEW